MTTNGDKLAVNSKDSGTVEVAKSDVVIVRSPAEQAAYEKTLHPGWLAGVILRYLKTTGMPRHENYLWEQLACDELMASIITDGHHLPPALLRCLLRVKRPGRLIVTCDASSLAGLPPGKYRQWDQEFEIMPEGKIVVPGTNYLAGSWAFTDLCVRNVLKLCETSLADTIDMASNHPRRLLGLPDRRLDVGEPADLILFDWAPEREFRLRSTLVNSAVVQSMN